MHDNSSVDGGRKFFAARLSDELETQATNVGFWQVIDTSAITATPHCEEMRIGAEHLMAST